MSPSAKLDGVAEVVIGWHSISLEGGVGRVVLFFIHTKAGWRGGDSSDKAQGEFGDPQEALLLPELAGERVAEEDWDVIWVGGGSAPLILFGAGTVADGFGWSFLFLSSTLTRLNLITTLDMYFRIMKIEKKEKS